MIASTKRLSGLPEGISLVWTLCLPALLGLFTVVVVGSLRVEIRSPVKIFYDLLSGLSLMFVCGGPIATAVAAVVLVKQIALHRITRLTAVFAWAGIVASALCSLFSVLLISFIIR